MGKTAVLSGIAGGLMGAGQELYNQHQEVQREIKTQRLMDANRLEQERLAKLRSEYDAVKDTRNHEQALEIEGVKSKSAAEREAARQTAADRRAEEQRKSSDSRADKSAAARVRAAEISANRPRGTGTGAKPRLFANDEGEMTWVTPGDEIPDGYAPAPASGKPKVEPKKPEPVAKTDPNAPPMAGAKKAPDGNWYVQKDGQWFKVN